MVSAKWPPLLRPCSLPSARGVATEAYISSTACSISHLSYSLAGEKEREREMEMAGGEYDESYQNRQEDEMEFLQAVFPGDFQDLRKNDPWDVSLVLRVFLLFLLFLFIIR